VPLRQVTGERRLIVGIWKGTYKCDYAHDSHEDEGDYVATGNGAIVY